MKTSEIRKLWKEIGDPEAKRVRISCDEYHAHSARQGCLAGDDPKDVLLCVLIETILRDRRKMREFIKDFQDETGEDDEDDGDED